MARRDGMELDTTSRGATITTCPSAGNLGRIGSTLHSVNSNLEHILVGALAVVIAIPAE